MDRHVKTYPGLSLLLVWWPRAANVEECFDDESL
jgi:hypothetical protein